MKKGPRTNEEQIKALREKLGEKESTEAEVMVDTFNPDIIALAYKLTRVNPTKMLPKAVSKLLDQMSSEDAKVVREKLAGVSK